MGAGSTFSQGVNSNTANPYGGTTDPYIAAAQSNYQGNLANAQYATQSNRVNQSTPYGSLNYTQNPNGSWNANQSLSQPLQQLTDSSIAGLQASQNNPMSGINPGQSYSDAIMQRLQPQMQQSQEQNTAALANQGIVPGTQAYDNQMRTFNQGQNDLLTSAQINGMNTGIQAQQLQNQTAAGIKSLSTPNYINPYTQATVSGPDYLGAYTTSQGQQIAQQNAANARTANTQSGLYGLGSAALLGGGGLSGLIGNTGNGVNAGSGLLGLFGNNSTPYNSATNNFFTDPSSAGAFTGSNFTVG